MNMLNLFGPSSYLSSGVKLRLAGAVTIPVSDTERFFEGASNTPVIVLRSAIAIWRYQRWFDARIVW